MKFKEGVDPRGVHDNIWWALVLLDELWRQELWYELVVTSLRDSVHHPNSRHYIGCAVDIRTWVDADSGDQLDGGRRTEICRLVREKLSEISEVDYLTLDEDNHFHIQLQRSSL